MLQLDFTNRYIFSHLKFCIALAKHKFKWQKILIEQLRTLGVSLMLPAFCLYSFFRHLEPELTQHPAPNHEKHF